MMRVFRVFRLTAIRLKGLIRGSQLGARIYNNAIWRRPYRRLRATSVAPTMLRIF